MTEPVTVRPVTGSAELDKFIKLPWSIYRDDPAWVPPLLMDVRAVLNPRKHPLHNHITMQSFLAWRGKEPVGRIIALVNEIHNKFHDEQLGFTALFECIDDQQVADALFAAAETWLRDRGMTAVRGPMALTTNEELASPGVLIDGFDTPPSILMNHTPRYYAPLFVKAGYAKAKDLIAYWVPSQQIPERLVSSSDKLMKRNRLVIRPLDMKRFQEEVASIQQIYNTAWERNWGFVPMSSDEIAYMAKQLKPVVNPELCGMAEVDGQPIGFILALPDYNQALRHVNGRLLPTGIFKLLWHRRKINAIRVITLGLKPEFRGKGIDALLILHVFRHAEPIDMARGECSWILEDNMPMRLAIEKIGGTAYKTYRVFEKPLGS
ncbi:MAG TPA: GNAT family N-acetyltransferase [Longimicrobiales bacterium]